MARWAKAVVAGVLCVAAGALVGASWSGGSLTRATKADSAAAPAMAARRNAGKPAVVVAAAIARDFPLKVQTFATVQAPATTMIGARVSSQVTEIHVKDGQIVRAGDLLFLLDDRALRAQLARDQATLAKDEAGLASAMAELDRAKSLLGSSISQQTLETAQAAAKAAQATIGADRATIDADNVQISYTRITAPFDGRLGTVGVSLGDMVGGSGSVTSLATLTAIDPVEVSFRLPERELPAIKAALSAGKPPTVTVLRPDSGETLAKGPLDFIDSAVDTTSGTIAMHATFENASQALWPGQSVTVVVEKSVLASAITVPAVAIQPGQDSAFVFVVKPDDTIERRPVTVAASDDVSAAVDKGLAAGEKVVVEGQLNLRPGQAVTTADAPAAAS
ncbi:efflux RND transporter periplasmic adaptor subunit [Shinella zoogloeoides]